jgi:hypothetical protein
MSDLFTTDIIIIGAWLVALFMLEYRRDAFWGIFMVIISAVAVGNTVLLDIAYNVINLPLVMMFISVYEILITLYMNSQGGAAVIPPQ